MINEQTNPKTEELEDELEAQFPNVGTLFRLNVSQETYNKILNFAVDFGIPNIVDLDNMFSPIIYSSDFIADVIRDEDRKFYGEKLELSLDAEPTEEGNRPLIVKASSEAFDALWEEIVGKHGEHNDSEFTEPSLHFVLSYDIEDVEIDEEMLEVRLNEYFEGVMSFQGVETDHLTHTQLIHKLDGVFQEDGGTKD